MKTRIVVVVLGLALAGVACGSGEPKSSAAEGATASGSGEAVAVVDFKFSPDSVEIAAGDQVVWTSSDAVLHTVTSGATTGAENKADGEFDGKLPKKGATFTHVFEEPGTYTYFCSQHNVMNGTIEVR